MDLYAEFEWRGLIYEATEGLREALAAGPLVGYIGFDPTAPSLHVGSLLPLTVLARFQRAGHRPIAIVGGGTGLIGDPSGKLQERPLLRAEEVRRHLEGLRAQIARFLDLERGARILDNAEWLAPLDLMSFLRDIGKHFTVNYLLQKESVRRRLEQASTRVEVVGIGVLLGEGPEGYPMVHQVLPGGPAAEGGLWRGALVVAVDGASTRDVPLDEVAQRIRGQAGTRVRLQLERAADR